MSGTRDGGLKARDTNKDKYGQDFYSRIGKTGGENGNTGGFWANRELARRAGTLGGQISTKSKFKPHPDEIAIIKQKFYEAL